jgi:hypothetical protein
MLFIYEYLVFWYGCHLSFLMATPGEELPFLVTGNRDGLLLASCGSRTTPPLNSIDDAGHLKVVAPSPTSSLYGLPLL